MKVWFGLTVTRLVSPVLQVLAVNILGRFLLNNDRNIRSVSSDLIPLLPHSPSPSSFLLPSRVSLSLLIHLLFLHKIKVKMELLQREEKKKPPDPVLSVSFLRPQQKINCLFLDR